ncbi:hypothetical protein [Paraburkholderia megapolitana]|uniref:hypothetical protein n=1 Tax=Paraburkholderia megapolitana TaxID=420953 RepID=UPI0038BA99EC
MRRFIPRPKHGKVDSDHGPLRIVIEGGAPPGHPEQVLKFFTNDGRAVVVRGGLPDLLQGEPPGRQWIGRGTAEVVNDEYLAEPVPMAAEDGAAA